MSLSKLLYCAIETGGENEIPFHFPQLFHTIPQREFFVKQFSPIFLESGEMIFRSGNSVSPLGKHNSPIFIQFPRNFPRLPPNFSYFRKIPTDSPRFPSFLCSFQYNFTSVVYIVSEHD